MISRMVNDTYTANIDVCKRNGQSSMAKPLAAIAHLHLLWPWP